MSKSTHTPYKLKGRDRDTDKSWTSLAVLENGKVVGQVTTWFVGSGTCYIKARTKDFKQYLLDNFSNYLVPITQRFYFETHSQKELSKIINLIKEKKSYGKI